MYQKQTPSNFLRVWYVLSTEAPQEKRQSAAKLILLKYLKRNAKISVSFQIREIYFKKTCILFLKYWIYGNGEIVTNNG